MIGDILFTQSITNWILVLLSASFIGLAKAGLKGIDILNVTLMAIIFGGKASTGIVLPLLCVADIMAVMYYHRHAQWNHFWKLLPGMVAGILIAVIIGRNLNEVYFRKIMAVIIVLIAVTMLIMEFRKNAAIPANKLFVVGTGLSAGFTTMFGNLAGAFANIYFLAMKLPKNHFIGTAAWVFLVVNFFKLPFQAFYWHNIKGSTLYMDLLLLPALVIGFLIGIKLVSRIKDTSYRKIIIVLTLIGAIFIFLKR